MPLWLSGVYGFDMMKASVLSALPTGKWDLWNLAIDYLSMMNIIENYNLNMISESKYTYQT